MDILLRLYKTINNASDLKFLVSEIILDHYMYLHNSGKKINYQFWGNSNIIINVEGTEPKDITFEKILKEYIEIEESLTLKSLDEMTLSNDINNDKILDRLENEFQKLIDDNYLFYNEYPFIYESLNKIISYVNEFLIPKGKEKLRIDTSRILYNQKSDAHKLVRDIFGYLNSKNEKGDVILNKEDYKYLLDKADYLISEDKAPSIERKINPNISLDTLSFTFWVLHKELFTTKRIRISFLETLRSLFINFENQEFGSIKKQFGSKTRVTDRKILPEIIKNHLE